MYSSLMIENRTKSELKRDNHIICGFTLKILKFQTAAVKWFSWATI